ncbi:Cdc42 effector protein 4 [Bos mutus]|uniref:Cdc42 effector protein 4 n=1 Tax=Bos mutus TaxID=72004 RepID=L8I419_9CETA|nr:Cdc42 effector protein 4 [Bos mutus]
MPILKQLVSSSVHSKRRSRVDLTAEMISAPLGDFRHTMHVGRAGDAFGDTSFLNSKAGELDGESVDEQAPSSSSSSKRSLLSRKFRASKRSQSVTRSDREQRDVLGSLRDSALFVKNAMSLPQLNEKEAAEKGSSKLPKSLSSSPVKKASAEGSLEEAAPPRNGAAAPHSPDPLLEEQAFGDLADLPMVPKASFGLKHAESIMSFHIDLGPSMLGDVLSVMDKGGEWEPEGAPDDGGYHSSLSSCTSGVLEERSPAFRGPERAPAALPAQPPDPEFSFMDEEEEDEIRV